MGINEEYDNVNESMYLDNLEEVKKYCNDIICYYSKNDPVCMMRGLSSEHFGELSVNASVPVAEHGIAAHTAYWRCEDIAKCIWSLAHGDM